MPSVLDRIVDGLLYLVSPWRWTSLAHDGDLDADDGSSPRGREGGDDGADGVGAPRSPRPLSPAGVAALSLRDEEGV